jgi:beta-glucosidase
MTTPFSRRARYATVAALLLAPARLGAQTPAWMRPGLSPDRRTALLIGAMTLEEKFQQLVGAPGVIPEIPACYGARHVPGIVRLGIPTFRITNGPVGVGQNDCVPASTPNLPRAAMMSTASAKATALPSAMAVAASFDPAVARDFGDVIGVETRNHALHVLEGPGLNLARVPQGGRNFEYFGEDPFLTGSMAVAEIRAIQKHGVIAMAKHFIANDHETNRGTENVVVADRVLHELYLLPFEMAVKSGDVASVMCSYNSVNGPHACEDSHHLTDVLRKQWGFKGYVQSDFFAVHTTVPTMLAGMDHEMP